MRRFVEIFVDVVVGRCVHSFQFGFRGHVRGMCDVRLATHAHCEVHPFFVAEVCHAGYLRCCRRFVGFEEVIKFNDVMVALMKVENKKKTIAFALNILNDCYAKASLLGWQSRCCLWRDHRYV